VPTGHQGRDSRALTGALKEGIIIIITITIIIIKIQHNNAYIILISVTAVI